MNYVLNFTIQLDLDEQEQKMKETMLEYEWFSNSNLIQIE